MSLSFWREASVFRKGALALAAVLLTVLLVFAVRITIELIAFDAIDIRAEGQKGLKNEGLIAQGAYLAKLGNCAACHTSRGGEAFAGGKPIHTPFGAVFASNITPDPVHGIGLWTADAFYRALHQGVSASGRLLTPAFPYPNYTHVSRADSDALFAYFQHGVKAVAQLGKPTELRFPFNTQLALAAWRVLFFSPSDAPIAPISIAIGVDSIRAGGQNGAEKTAVDRGRYIVNGLAHCSACHAQRNALGATDSDGLLSGALMPMQDWYAPSLHAREEAGVQHWPREQLVAFLQHGVTNQASALGPMAEVVAKSTQYWRDEDLQATAAYLQSLALRPVPSRPAASVSPQSLSRGAALYTQHCATCHGDNGQGLQESDSLQSQGKVQIPALAGNRAVSLSSSANLVRIILAGGYAPSTAGNPHPYGMPPFVHVLGDEEIAAVATYIRASWGNAAPAVSGSEVVAHRRGVLQ